METPEEDPRGTDVADGGYPEQQESGADPGTRTRTRTRKGDDSHAPGTSSDSESDAGTATGNPDNAGG